MKLLYEAGTADLESLCLRAHEKIRYRVPLDLEYDTQSKKGRRTFVRDGWLVVTTGRIMICADKKVIAQYELENIKKIKCEHQVNCGIITVTDKEGTEHCMARMSMRHIERVSYVIRGVEAMVNKCLAGEDAGEADVVESTEYEKYCEKCQRAMPGTSKCPYCDGKSDIIKKFLSLCGEYTGKLIFISALMVVKAIVTLLVPMVQRYFIDNSLSTGSGTWRDLYWFIGVTLFLVLAGIGVELWKSWNCTKLGASLSLSLREKLYYKIQVLSLSFVNKRKPGELMNRLSRDTAQVRDFTQEVFGDMFSTLFTMVVAMVVMFTISVKMTLMALAFVILAFVLSKMFFHKIWSIFHRQWLKMDDLSSSLQDVISGIRIVKSFGKEESETKKFAKKAGEYAELSKTNETFWAILFPILSFFMGAGTYVAILFGGIDVLNGEMSLGELVQFVTYCGYLFGPLGWMTHLPRAIMQMITSLNRIYDVLDEEPDIADKEDSLELEIQGAFSFNDISFGYQTYEPVLEHVSFDVKPGEMIGLVGQSGTGKSTLINLIMRLYDVDQGSITIDGADIKKIKKSCLHSQIGVVLQETFLFSGSIIDNIRFAKPDASLTEVIMAAKAANAHDFICKTPDGYNTYVGEHGYNLSGGERQRIAIARAILNNPRLLILDEATSALDTESEYLIQQALDRLVKGRTTFAIAHRLSTLRNADRLVVIDKHEVAEIGTHNELLEMKGIYYGLVNAQLKMNEGVTEA